ncbi:hypothetical protein ACUJHZ_004916, partial [Salmonella enterica subsp. enterica serovar Alachua]
GIHQKLLDGLAKKAQNVTAY